MRFALASWSLSTLQGYHGLHTSLLLHGKQHLWSGSAVSWIIRKSLSLAIKHLIWEGVFFSDWWTVDKLWLFSLHVFSGSEEGSVWGCLVVVELVWEQCLHFLHQVKLVPSVGWTISGMLFVTNPVDDAQYARFWSKDDIHWDPQGLIIVHDVVLLAYSSYDLQCLKASDEKSAFLKRKAHREFCSAPPSMNLQ